MHYCCHYDDYDREKKKSVSDGPLKRKKKALSVRACDPFIRQRAKFKFVKKKKTGHLK